jgi:MYXO-CTERM domain-containing protein
MNHCAYPYIALACCLALVGCSEATHAPAEQLAAPTTPADAHTLSASALVDRQGDNWIVFGGPNVDLVGRDGEPDAPAGRLINAGKGAHASAVGPDGWLVGGADGATITLDAEGKPIRGDVRIMIDGAQIGFIAAGKDLSPVGDPIDVFLVGGADGKIQIADNTGEPFAAKKATAGAALLTAGAFSQELNAWIFGAQDGQVYRMTTGTTTPSAQGRLVGDVPVVAIFPNAATNNALVLGGQSASYYPAANPVDLGAGISITAAARRGDQIIIGLADGRVGSFSYGAIAPPARWQQVFTNQAVSHIADNGTSLVAFSDAGQGAILDASLAPASPPVTLGDGAAVRAARWSGDRWLLATDASLILEVDASLKLLAAPATPLDGRELRAASAGVPGVLVVGDAGRVRLLDRYGTPQAGVQTVPGEPTLHAAGFSGKNWLVAGTGGVGHLVNASGSLEGQPLNLLGGRDVRGIVWSGTTWLVVGAGGHIQRVRDDGTIAGEITKVMSLDEAYAARWSGSDWMVVGVQGGRAAYQLINPNGNPRGNPGRIDAINGPFYAVEWNGREWLLGGHAGNVQIIGADGTPRRDPAPQPRDVLGGQDILTIDYNNDTYLIGGGRGFVRQLRDNLQTPRPPVSVAAFKEIRAVAWTSPRGFAGGLCLTPASCYAGPCLGTFKEGFCCDRACDRPCESCNADKTGQPDGTCAPILSGQPPATVGACAAEAPASCGTTGVCDGKGECQKFDTSTQCQAPACSNGLLLPAGSCDGEGMCAVGAPTSCAPYATCNGAACATSCLSSNDCVEGYICQDSACIIEPMNPPPPPKKAEDDGCATTQPAAPASAGWLLAAAGIILSGLRRRRR